MNSVYLVEELVRLQTAGWLETYDVPAFQSLENITHRFVHLLLVLVYFRLAVHPIADSLDKPRKTALR